MGALATQLIASDSEIVSIYHRCGLFPPCEQSPDKIFSGPFEHLQSATPYKGLSDAT